MEESGEKWGGVFVMFMGSFEHRIDSKGRLVLPARYRQSLGDAVVCTVGLDRCVAVYPMDEWERYLEKLRSLPFAKNDARQFMRAVLGAAEELTADKQGRILINARLRAYAGLGEEVIVSGVMDHLEVWNKERWTANDAAMLENFTSLAEGVGDLGI